MAATLTPETRAAIDREVDAGYRKASVVRRRLAERGIAVGRYAVQQRVEAYAAELASVTTGETVQSFETEGDRARVECVVHSSGGVVTEQDLVRVCGIDLTRWRIRSMKVKAYQTGMKLAEKEQGPSGTIRRISEQPHIVQLHSVAAELERVVPRGFDEAVTSFFEQFRSGVEPLPPAIHVGSGRRVMAEFDLCDVHFGKLAYHRESGENYDLRIAERVFSNAIEDLIDAARGREIERIRVTLGNDYTHIDNGNNTTTGGTPVDTDGRFTKINKVALWSMYRAGERWRSIAPTELVLVRGNHDWNTIVGIAQALDLKFSGDESISVDTEPAARKYRLYGRTLIGYQHGDELRDTRVCDLPGLMMKEAPRAWLAEAEFHEFHIGHHHRERKFTTRDTDTGLGMVIRWMHSLSAADEWHYRRSYLGARRAAEVYFYDREHGYKGHSLALARD